MSINRVMVVVLVAALLAGDDKQFEVYFSPRGGCTVAIIGEIEKAKNEIVVQAYGFSSQAITDALIKAHNRDVSVRAILDKNFNSDPDRTTGDDLTAIGIDVRLDGKHAIAHNKVMVIDEKTVITGSFNFSKSAETANAENLLIIHDKVLAKRYRDNWLSHNGHADKPDF